MMNNYDHDCVAVPPPALVARGGSGVPSSKDDSIGLVFMEVL